MFLLDSHFFNQSIETLMRVLLVYNAQAAHKRAKKILPDVETCFIGKGIKFDLQLTDYPEHAVDIVGKADFGQYDGVIAAGGDGTLFEVINGYYKNSDSGKIPLGVLPIGTGNAFARDFELDVSRWENAVEIISLGKPRYVDVGKYHTHGRDYYFLNILGLGFVADVGKTAQKFKIFGNISYTLGVFYQMVFLKAYRIKIEADGRTFERENIFVEISNTRYTSNFLMAPNAEIDDGLLDVTLLDKATRRRLIQCFPKIFTGEHIHMDEVEQFKAKKITVETDIPKVLTPDGELMGITPVQVECLHKAVPVFWK